MMTNLIAPGCSRCGLALTRYQVVQPTLPPRMRVLFLGRDPGQVEDRMGLPFHPTAPAGKLLRRLIAEVGIDSAWCGFDNAVHCHTPKNRGPKADEVLVCSFWRDFVEKGIPKTLEFIVPLGQEALEALMRPDEYHPKKPLQTLAEVRGQVQDGDHGRKILPMYHPSAALRNSLYQRLLMVDLVHLAELLGINRHLPQYQEYMGWWPPIAGMVALDTETTRDGMLLGLGMAWRGPDGWVWAWYTESLDLMRAILQTLPPETSVMHNSYFDIEVLRQARLWGGSQEAPHDTEVMAQLLGKRETVGSLGLKQLALADLGYSWPGIPEFGHPAEMTYGSRSKYCMRDAVATLELAEKYLKELEEV